MVLILLLVPTAAVLAQESSVEIKSGEVIKVIGSNLWVRTEGMIKSREIPPGFVFVQDGKHVTVDELHPGTMLTAEIVYKSEEIVTEKDVQIGGVAPAAPSPEPVTAAPAPEAEPAPVEMPKTASNLALVALLELALVAAGFAVRRS